MKFRYSSLSTAMFCNKKFELQHIKGLKEPGLEPEHFVFGRGVHLIPQTHFDGGDAENVFQMYWRSIDPDNHEWGRYGYDELGKIGSEFARKWVKGHAKHYEPLHVEKPIEFNVNGFTVTGTPDFIGQYRGKLSIVDWKTTASDYDKKKALVDSQTWLYAEGAKQVYGLEVEQVVYAPFVKYGAKVQTPICVSYSERKSKSMLANATLLMRDLSTREEFPRNEQNCLRCRFISTCYSEDA